MRWNDRVYPFISLYVGFQGIDRKLAGCIFDSVRAKRIFLKFGIMGCRRYFGTLTAEILKHRNSQSCALYGIGSRSELID